MFNGGETDRLASIQLMQQLKLAVYKQVLYALQHDYYLFTIPWVAKLLSKSSVKAGSPPEPLICKRY